MFTIDNKKHVKIELIRLRAFVRVTSKAANEKERNVMQMKYTNLFSFG